jgi:hypothetical protein
VAGAGLPAWGRGVPDRRLTRPDGDRGVT